MFERVMPFVCWYNQRRKAERMPVCGVVDIDEVHLMAAKKKGPETAPEGLGDVLKAILHAPVKRRDSGRANRTDTERPAKRRKSGADKSKKE